MRPSEPIETLTQDARILLDSILLAFKGQFPFANKYTDEDFLSSAHVLLEAGAIKILQHPDGSMTLKVHS